jgi:hypothetical protein
LHNGDAVSIESPAASLSQRFERGLVACPFDKYDHPRLGDSGEIEVHDPCIPLTSDPPTGHHIGIRD